MKVYVDELPSCCEDCVFCRQTEYYYYCDKLHTKLGYFDKEKDCPLQSLAEHDKQVRKEAVKQVLDFIEEHKEYYFEKRDYYGAEYIFFNRSNLEKDILDQIQEKGE